MSVLAVAPDIDGPSTDEIDPLIHICTFEHPDVALCGEDLTDADWDADPRGELCVVCGHLSGELTL
jgi:hypothetical protein